MFSIIEQNNKFIVTRNNVPVKKVGEARSNLVTEFDSMDDAEKYMKILLVLEPKKEKTK